MELIRSVLSIRALCAVEEHGSFSGAAAAMGMTQSAVSQHVASLEAQAGLPLVERRSRPVELTPAGRVVVRHGRVVAARLEAAEVELAELAGRRNARLRLGSFPTALATFVPAAIGRLRREIPEVALSVTDDHIQRLLPRLQQGELDLAIVFTDPGQASPALADCAVTELFTDEYRLLLPARHPLAHGTGDLALTDLRDETWIGGAGDSTWFQLVRAVSREAGFEPRVGLVSDDHLAVQAFVAAGLGVAVVPGLAAVRRLPGVEVRRLHGPRPARLISAAHPAEPDPPGAATAMIDALRAVTRRWATDPVSR